MKRFFEIFLVVFFVVSSSWEVKAQETNDLILFKGKTIHTSKEPIKAKVSSHILSNKNIYLIIQFKNSVREEDKKEIQKIGAEFLRYVPQKSFIIRISEKQYPLLYNFKTLQWIGDYTSELKIDPKLSKEPKNENIALHVQFFSEDKMDAIIGLVKKHQGSILYRKKNFLKISAPRKVISDIANMESVEWIEEAKKPVLLNFQEKTLSRQSSYNELTGFESGVTLLNMEKAYEKNLKGQTQIVAIADTGLDMGKLEELSEDFKKKVVKGYTLGFFAEDWSDQNGHGTHVAGSILGAGLSSQGRIKGGAFEAKAVIQGLWGMFGDLNIPPDLADLLSPPYEDGARIHSNSWGHPSSGYDQYSRSVDKFVWDNPEMIVVISAGNSGEDTNQDGVIDSGSLYSPADAKNCVTVGASENLVLKGGVQKMWKETRAKESWKAEPIASDHISDNPNGIAAFSSRGPTSDGRLKPDIVAPGTNILSARSHHPKAETLHGVFNENYVWASGTSMSAPLTAGAVAVIRQFLATHVKNPSAALVKATLLNGAKDLYPGQFGFSKAQEIPTHRPNIHEGWGRVDVDQSLSSYQFIDEKKGLESNQTKEFKIPVKNSSEPLRITMVYSDYPATSGAQKALVNDLDLELVDPHGKKYTSLTSPKGPDRVNNVEGIDIDKPVEGSYTIRVIGYHVPQGKNGAQPFALVISGGIQ